MNTVRYESEVVTVPFGKDKTIRIEHCTPVLNDKEREKARKEIELRLFDIFIKYE